MSDDTALSAQAHDRKEVRVYVATVFADGGPGDEMHLLTVRIRKNEDPLMALLRGIVASVERDGKEQP